MNTRLLCCWLGLPEQSWPPDSSTLLGLEPGQTDVSQVECRVQECMARLRCYQVSHPEEATEGMNRLAQAFIEITEKIQKRRAPVIVAVGRLPGTVSPSFPACPGSVSSGGDSVGSPGPGIASSERHTRVVVQDDTAVEGPRRADWRTAPPPVRKEGEMDSHENPAGENLPPVIQPTEGGSDQVVNGQVDPAGAEPGVTSAVPLPQAVSPAAPPVDPVVELAWNSREARRGLGTLPRLLERIEINRALRHAWIRVGKYLRRPDRKLKPAEEHDLARRMDRIFRLIEDEEFPGFLGQPGQPGYRVVAMARLEMTAAMFKGQSGKERQDLARDWAEGERVLFEHHRFLRRSLMKLRGQSYLHRVWTASWSPIRERPLVSGAIAAAAAVLAAWFLLS